MQSLIDERTKLIVVVNPSNPCGSVWSRQHCLEVLDVAARNKLPLINDELYEDLVYDDEYPSFRELCGD